MFDTEKFILEVESRPPLYDTKLKEYSNKLVKANCWIEVAKVMHENWDEMSNEDQDKAGMFSTLWLFYDWLIMAV